MKKYKSKLDYIKDNYSLENMTHDDMCDLCVEMWNEMIENGYKRKSYSKIIKNFDRGVATECFACHFYDFLNNDCSKCEFSVFRDDNDINSSCYCENEKSPYYNYLADGDLIKENMIEICELFI